MIWWFTLCTRLVDRLGNRLKLPGCKVLSGVLVMGWSFTALILSNTYRGKIVSSLLVTKHIPVINSLEDLTTSSLSWIVLNGTPIYSTILVISHICQSFQLFLFLFSLFSFFSIFKISFDSISCRKRKKKRIFTGRLEKVSVKTRT